MMFVSIRFTLAVACVCFIAGACARALVTEPKEVLIARSMAAKMPSYQSEFRKCHEYFRRSLALLEEETMHSINLESKLDACLRSRRLVPADSSYFVCESGRWVQPTP